MWTQRRAKKVRREKVFSFLLACQGAVSTCVLWFCRSRVTKLLSDEIWKMTNVFWDILGLLCEAVAVQPQGWEGKTIYLHAESVLSPGDAACASTSLGPRKTTATTPDMWHPRLLHTCLDRDWASLRAQVACCLQDCLEEEIIFKLLDIKN